MSGGFADVYRGRYQRKDVALKVLRAFSNTNQVTQDILIRKLHYEALLWRNINHRHVLPFLGIDDCIFNSGACMVSAYMAHGYVRHKTEALLRQYGQDDLYYRRYIYKWLYETALGLDYLHEEGIVHGDLRGPNILIDETRSVLLADFGLSVFAESNSRQNGSSRGGNPRWMAPEQLDPEGCGKNSDRPTIHSDVFSFACVCVELYTSQIPYQELTDYQVLMGVPQGRRPAFKTRNTDFELDVGIPLEPLKRLANRCWSHAPEERPHIKEIVSHMADLQIPWASSPMSNTWPVFDSGC
ncbi:hypothetical protein QCA50_014308 [Cerrena zonata]|uniref:Protein kinase domain-containing protein n=1 Tax=Cerrena zonata TaxID=2478898 RepID=A0AAW0FLJ4_9APHY